MRRVLLVLGTCVAPLVMLVMGAPAGAAGGGGGCHEPATDGEGVTVELKESCFSPTVLRVAEATTVSFENRDEMPHVVLGTGWGSGESLAVGGVATYRFDAAGIYPYSCYLHPSMNGAVVVGDGRGSGTVTEVAAPAVAGDSGSLAAGDVPGGATDGREAPVAAIGGALIGGGVIGLAIGWFWLRRARAGG